MIGNSTNWSMIFKGRELLLASRRAKGVPTRITIPMLIVLVTRDRRSARRACSLTRLLRKSLCWPALIRRAITGRHMKST